VAGYSLQIRRSAAKEIDRVEPVAVRRKIVARIAALADDPQPNGSEKLAGSERTYRLRQGDFRIVYDVDDAFRTVVIVRVAHRKEAYR
jgi:mRNA interferase RelE/StbE